MQYYSNNLFLSYYFYPFGISLSLLNYIVVKVRGSHNTPECSAAGYYDRLLFGQNHLGTWMSHRLPEVCLVVVAVVVVVVVLPIVVVVLLPFPPFSHPVLSLFSFFFLSARLARPEHPTPTVIRTQPHLGKIADSNTTTPPHLGASPTCTIPRVHLQLYQLLCRLG